MATNRLEILQKMVEQDPKNSFARYGLAMEYAAGGTLEQAVAEYRKLIGNDPAYVAAYFHGGQASRNWESWRKPGQSMNKGLRRRARRETGIRDRKFRRRSICFRSDKTLSRAFRQSNGNQIAHCRFLMI